MSWTRRRGRPEVRPSAHLLLPADEPDVLVVIDVWSPSCRFAIGAPLEHLDPRRTAVLTSVPAAIRDLGPDKHDTEFGSLDQLPHSIRAIVTLGAYNDLAGRVEPWAQRHDASYFVVQHGLLTPWAPPLNDGAHLLAWSEEDGDYWTAGRTGVSWRTVGSQMLWDASRQPSAPVLDEHPVLLGQLHGTELPRSQKQRLYIDFTRRTGAEYRPHPNEADVLSRLQHRVMRAAGVHFVSARGPITEMGRPVVSIFSTGTLEAAHHGLPAWVHHPSPPAWLSSFWNRYGLSPYGSAPTSPISLPSTEPARTIARLVQS